VGVRGGAVRIAVASDVNGDAAKGASAACRQAGLGRATSSDRRGGVGAVESLVLAALALAALAAGLVVVDCVVVAGGTMEGPLPTAALLLVESSLRARPAAARAPRRTKCWEKSSWSPEVVYRERSIVRVLAPLTKMSRSGLWWRIHLMVTSGY